MTGVLKIGNAEGDFLEFRGTPWDKRSLGLNALEVMNIRCADEARLARLFIDLDEYCTEQHIELAYLRIDATDKLAKKVLNHSGFEFIETSLKVVNPNIRKCDFEKKVPARFELHPATREDIPQIVGIARDAFNFSRFHEDYNIGETAARQRYADWIGDLQTQQKKFLVYRAGGAVRSILVYDEIEGGAISLILAGSEKSQGYLSPFFWSSFLAKLKDDGAKRIEAVISAANVPVINLYTQFGFVVEKSYFGFHKYFSQPDGK